LSPLLSEITWVVAYPLACLWAAVVRLRRRLFSGRPRVCTHAKTVVVGNLHSGGSGKTPIVAAIAERFVSLHPAIVSRGYGGSLSARGAQVDLSRTQGPRYFGDEPWMLAKRVKAPVFIGRARGKALQRAEANQPVGFLLLDDAFQNFSFRHDVNLVAIQADRDLRSSHCLPLGDLREPLSALDSATAVVLVVGQDELSLSRWKVHLARHFAHLPVFEARAQVEGVWGEQGAVAISQSLKWGAFSGIARPDSFAASLSGVIDPIFLEAFSDHQVYSAELVDRLQRLQAAHGVHHLITTEKDWHKAAPLFAERSQALFYLRIGYVFSDQFWYFLQTHLETA
jgi:tetraacyldisaccharide 4'-kinase